MSNIHTVRPVAVMRSDFPEKFGIPRQAGIVPELESLVVFEPDYRDPEALRGIEGFSHLWLIWQFSESVTESFSPTVRPPRLGGNRRMGVFATRSPFRPNALGLSCVELKAVETRPGLGTVLVVRGADLMDGTPIYDIKPYVPYADCHPEASAGFAPDSGATLSVELPDDDYPLMLTTGRILYHYNACAMTSRTEGLNEIANSSFIEINTADAEALGIADGDRVKVTSRRASIHSWARVSGKTNPGETWMPFHFQDGNSNWLTIAALDNIAKAPEFKVCAVKVEKANA